MFGNITDTRVNNACHSLECHSEPKAKNPACPEPKAKDPVDFMGFFTAFRMAHMRVHHAGVNRKRRVFVFVFVGLLLFAAAARPQDTTPNFPPEFSTAKIWNKLGDKAKAAWLSEKQSGDMGQRFDCIVRVRSPYDPGDRTFMESHGMVVQVAAGTMVRGHMKAKDVPDVAELPFVAEVNLWTPKVK